MMNIKVLALNGLILLAAGCNSLHEDSTPIIISIAPSEGATDVETEVTIRVTFNESMDIDSCEERFGLFEGSIIEIPSNMAGNIPGEFSWNSDNSEMIFHPQDDLLESRDYSICLIEGMQTEHNHDEMMMDHHNNHGMMLHDMEGFGMNADTGIIIKFLTL